MICLGFGGQDCRSHSMMVVITGGFGHGNAQPIIHKTGSATTCKLSATRKASNNGIVSVRNLTTVSCRDLCKAVLLHIE
ncbi:hypothetical protein BH10CYA1_BH10CYA1_24390 [soil metagenome]